MLVDILMAQLAIILHCLCDLSYDADSGALVSRLDPFASQYRAPGWRQALRM